MKPRISLISVIALVAACHHQRLAHSDGRDPAIAALFRDTLPSTRYSAEGRTYNVQNPAERKALEATLARERALWDAAKPRDYRFLARSECFCPGPTRWLLLEVRHNQAVRVWDASGRRVETTAGSLNIDALFDNLARVRDPLTQVQVAFDEEWHYPRFLRTSMAYPDSWSVVVVRGLHPL
jgi:hypothetical protein